jgi:hypothetical protein
VTIASVLAARDGRRFFRKIAGAFFGGACPTCSRPANAHGDAEADACIRSASYWTSALLAEIAAKLTAPAAKRAPRRRAA